MGEGIIFIYMSCVLRYRQQRSSLLLKFLPGLFGLDPMFSAKPDVSAVLSTANVSENRVHYREAVSYTHLDVYKRQVQLSTNRVPH